MAGRDWASLPSELLDLIVGKLKPAEDYVRFRATCKPWRSATSHQIRQRRSKKLSMLPMLVREITRFKDEEEEEEDVEISLFALKQLGSSSVISSGLILRPLNSVPPFDKAENHGWLASLDKWLALTLSNPFTGKIISLPPIKETTPRERYMFSRSASYSRHRVALSADPDLFPDDFEVLVQFSSFLAHRKSGDESWTCSTSVSFTSIDLAYWKGPGRFVVLTERPVNLTTKFAFNLICVPTITSCPDRPRTPRISSIYSDKIVESSGGDLLLVKMFWYLTYIYSVDQKEEEEVNVIRIFKLMLGDSAGGVEQSKWVEIKSIGSDALFLDLGKLICVSALDFPDQCRRNCIYCTDGLKYGVFNLEDGVMEKWNEIVDHYENHLRRLWLSWALPTVV